MAAYSVSAGAFAGLTCKGLTDAQCDQLIATLLTALPRQIPVDMHIGNGDPTYPYLSNDYDRFVAQGWGDGQTIFYTIFVGGHDYSTTDLQQAWGNLCPQAVIP
jgi:hypothetical protein